MQKKDLWIAPVLEGALILVVALVGWITQQPLVFASLGPTAYELIELPKQPSARPYNIIVGNLIAMIAAFIALAVTDGWAVPSVSANGVPLLRVWAILLAVVLTVFGTLLARANQPAALSTTLLISAGLMQSLKDGAIIMAGVLLLTILGEPIRRYRAKTRTDGPAE